MNSPFSCTPLSLLVHPPLPFFGVRTPPAQLSMEVREALRVRARRPSRQSQHEQA